MRKESAICSELAIARQSATHRHVHFDRDSTPGKEVGKIYSGRKGRLRVCPDWRLLAWGSCKRVD